MAKILKGDVVADKIIQEQAEEISELLDDDVKPALAVILVGDDPVSKIYVEKKQARVEGLGLGFNLYEFLPIAKEEQVIELIESLNNSENINGILVQLPLPASFSKQKILEKIDPQKDVDSLTGKSEFVSPTAQAIMEILSFYKISVKNEKVAVIGQGDLAGKPFTLLAKKAGAQVTVCDENTKDIAAAVKGSQILVSGVGKPGLITADMVNEKMTVVDAGTSIDKGNQVGDVDFVNVAAVAKNITPAKGGVGPVTIACLIKNLVEATKRYRT